jgi:hypothetical protein
MRRFLCTFTSFAHSVRFRALSHVSYHSAAVSQQPWFSVCMSFVSRGVCFYPSAVSDVFRNENNHWLAHQIHILWSGLSRDPKPLFRIPHHSCDASFVLHPVEALTSCKKCSYSRHCLLVYQSLVRTAKQIFIKLCIGEFH